MTYLLDTNVWVTLLRTRSTEVATRFHTAAPTGDLRVCSIVRAALRYGALAVRNQQPTALLWMRSIAPYPSLPFDDAAADQHAALRQYLEGLGQVIGPLDLQIAAIALANGCTLVTHNTAEFGRVPSLLIEDGRFPDDLAFD